MSVQTWLMLAGAALVLFGGLLRWRVSHYDLKDAAIDSAWTLARGKRTAENPTALEAKYREIRSAADLERACQEDGRHRRRPFHRPGAGRRVAGDDAGGLAAILAGWLWR